MSRKLAGFYRMSQSAHFGPEPDLRVFHVMWTLAIGGAERVVYQLEQLLGDPPLRDRMASAARARYLASFTQERTGRRLADWLASVATGHNAQSSGSQDAVT